MGGGLGTRGVRSAAISSAALLFAILLFTFRTKVQLFSANEGLLLSVAARDGSQTRIRPEQKKNAREHKLDEYMKQRKGYCDEQGKWTTLTFDENESEYKNKKVIAYSEYADSQFDPTLTEERTVVMQTCEIEDKDERAAGSSTESDPWWVSGDMTDTRLPSSIYPIHIRQNSLQGR